jgi:hypothetical protein
MSLLARRPAESAAVTTGGVAALALALAAHDYTAAAIVAVTAVIPAAVTYLKTHGGIAGVEHELAHGSRASNGVTLDSASHVRVVRSSNVVFTTTPNAGLTRPDVRPANDESAPPTP